jgi:opacity protein-like surface antigen
VAALGALALACAAPAKAADVYAGGLKDTVYVPMPTWTGFYFGLHAGGAWSNFDNHDRNIFFDEPLEDGRSGVLVPDRNLNGTGFFGGAQFGYNWQGGANCCFVYGIEVDLGGLDTGGKDRTFTVFGDEPAVTGLPDPSSRANAAIRVKTSGGFYGDVTGRVGYTFGSALLYAKGGFAWLNANLEVSEVLTPRALSAEDPRTPAFFNGDGNNNTTLTGWTLGAGLEYLITPTWSVKLEYLHFDFGNIDRHCCFDTFDNDFHIRHDVTVDTVKVGINYHLAPTPVVLPYK